MAGSPAFDDEAEVAKGHGDASRSQLVALLVSFLKEYHLSDQDQVIKTMLQDVASGSKDPRTLALFGEVSVQEVGLAVAAFEVWKAEGRINMPAHYFSQTHQQHIPCVVVRRNNDGSLDLFDQIASSKLEKTGVVKLRADPILVRPRQVQGWFVPPRGASNPVSKPAAVVAAVAVSGESAEAQRANMAREEARRANVARESERLARETAEAQKAERVAREAAEAKRVAAQQQPQPPAVAAPRQDLWQVLYAFNGPEYGPEYLVLAVGDFIEFESDDGGGWAFGKVARRAGAALPGASLGSGWYPSDFAERCSA